MKTFFALLILIFPLFCVAQINGCTEMSATNFNASATQNDGSCVFAPISANPQTSITLSDTLNESSGLIIWKNEIWSHNDNDDNNLYRINESNGSVQEIVNLPQTTNIDWEEISQDSAYIYVGDFGNNGSGNRTDLHILRILKSTLHGNIEIDTIAFQYSNQTDFSPSANNATNFDCEAFVISSDSIFLFTKRWNDKKAFLYALPKTAGNHVAVLKDSLNIQGLVTGATLLENKNLVVLCGYNAILQPFVFLLYDFQNQAYFSGNKRKIGLSLPYTQIEGITTRDGLTYYFSNERFTAASIITTQKLHKFDLSNFLLPYLTAGLENQETAQDLSIFPNPVSGFLSLSFPAAVPNCLYNIKDISGKTVSSGKIESTIDVSFLQNGTYFLLGNDFLPQRFVVQ